MPLEFKRTESNYNINMERFVFRFKMIESYGWKEPWGLLVQPGQEFFNHLRQMAASLFLKTTSDGPFHPLIALTVRKFPLQVWISSALKLPLLDLDLPTPQNLWGITQHALPCESPSEIERLGSCLPLATSFFRRNRPS